MFSCEGCGLKRHELQVPARETEDVVAWVRQVNHHVSVEHRHVSPRCHAVKCDLYLPNCGEFIGQQVE